MKLRIALSGSAGTGKTTLARALAARLGLPLIPEAMRTYLEAGGPRLDRLSRDQGAERLARFREDLLAEELRLGAFVADNGPLDLEAYGRWYGCPGEPDAHTWTARYDAVVLLPAGVIPYQRDGVRREDPEEEARFQGLLEGVAEASPLGPVLLRMPRVASLEERVAWVRNRLEGAALGR